jgi:hypothetical protein
MSLHFDIKCNNQTYESAKTTRVLVTFSIVYFVLPLFPAIRPIARDRLSPFSGFTGDVKEIIE